MTDLFEQPHGLFNDDGQTLTADEVEKEKQRLAAKIAVAESDESRALRMSTVTRSVNTGTDSCLLCRSNTDPSKVPLHPNCTCDVKSDDVETGVVSNEHPYFRVLQTATEDILLVAEDMEMPNGIQLDSASTAVLDLENLRFADLARWLEQAQPYIDAGAEYVSIVVDEETGEAAEEIVTVLEGIASGTQELPEGIRNKQMWLSIAKAVVM
jgi:hypothetical protein